MPSEERNGPVKEHLVNEVAGIEEQYEVPELWEPIEYPSLDIPEKQPEQAPEIGFAREEEDQEAWEVIRQVISQMPLTTNGRVSGELDNKLLRIESGFRFWPEAEDDDFSPYHVEPLIDQAADLLDRGIRLRASWDELAAKRLELLLEVKEYAELDKIHQEEEQAGVYGVKYRVINEEYFAADKNWGLLRMETASSESAYNNLFSFSIRRTLPEKAWWTAFLSGEPHYLHYQGALPSLKRFWYKIGPPAYPGEQVSTARYHLGRFARSQFLHNFDVSKQDHWLTVAERRRELAIAVRHLTAKVIQRKWEAKDRNFARRRTIVARDLQDIKAKAVKEADGVLNYGKRLDAMEERFSQDFRDALARLFVVKEGLQKLYGYTDPFPQDTQSIDYFDKCLRWTRKAIQWLIRFSRQEQSLVLPISIREHSNWKNGLKTGSWEAYIPESYFDSMAHVRLRGISAVVRSSTGDERLWQLEIRIPDQSKIRHKDSGEIQLLDQTKIPPVLIGRVASRESRRDPDIVGVAALHNASPINAWKVRVLGSVPSSDGFEGLEDIVLDVLLAFRYLKGTASPLQKGERNAKP